jgi:hypothetical protein
LGILLHTVLSILNPDFIQENEVINYFKPRVSKNLF